MPRIDRAIDMKDAQAVMAVVKEERMTRAVIIFAIEPYYGDLCKDAGVVKVDHHVADQNKMLR
jgi:hypothetical protein